MNERDEGAAHDEQEPRRQPPPPPSWPAPPDQPPAGAEQWQQPPRYGQPPPGYGAPGYGQPAPGYGGPPSTPAGRGSALHPLDLGRTLSVGWSLFRFRWRSLFAAVLIVMVPAHALNLLWYMAYGEEFERWLAAVQAGPTTALEGLPPLAAEALPLLFGVSIVLGVAGVVAAAAMVHILAWTYGGGSATVSRALERAVARVPSLIAAFLLAGIAVLLIIAAGAVLAAFAVTAMADGLGVFLALVIGVATFAAVVFVTLRWLFYVPAIVLEENGGMEGLGRSWRLVAGSTWRVLGYMLVLVVLMIVVGIVAGLVGVLLFGLGSDLLTGQPEPFDALRVSGRLIVNALGGIVLLPFYWAVMLLLYYDLRFRDGEQIEPPPA